MSRLISDQNLLTWEVYPSGGAFGFPQQSKMIFQCLSDPDRRSRFLDQDADSAAIERELRRLSDDDLNQLLARSVELD